MVGLDTLTLFELEGTKSIGKMNAVEAPAVSDVNGDGKLEFMGVRYNNVLVINDDGSPYWYRALNTYYNSPAVFADLDNNSRMEMGIVAFKMPWESGDLIAYLWEIPKSDSNTSKYDWPMFSHDPQRTGRLSFTGSVTPGDTTPPITCITLPSNGSTVSGMVNVADSASDNVGVSKVELYIDGALIDTKISSPFTFVWDTTKVTNGDHTLQSKAYDAKDNTGYSAKVTVTSK